VFIKDIRNNKASWTSQSNIHKPKWLLFFILECESCIFCLFATFFISCFSCILSLLYICIYGPGIFL